jgi:Glycosyl transferase family 90
MRKIKQNLKGLYLSLKKDNFYFQISQAKLNDKINNFPSWMEESIQYEIKNFQKNSLDIDKTIQNLKDQNLLQKAQVVKVIIKNNKISYKNYLSPKLHSRFIRLNSFLKRASSHIHLPEAIFLFSISDSLDDQNILDCLQAPVFCISKKINNDKVILFPHVEWLSKNDFLLKSISKTSIDLTWENKLNIAFWRGSTTGALNLEKNERFKIIKLSSHYPELIDACFSKICQISLEHQKLLLENYPLKNSVFPEEHLRYKYLLSIDGNAFGGSFFWQMFSNSVILKNKSDYLEWYYHALKPDKHFVQFESDKDLVAKVNWLKDNDDRAKMISLKASNFAYEYLSNEDHIAYVYHLLDRYSKL